MAALLSLSASAAFADWNGRVYTNDTDTSYIVSVYVILDAEAYNPYVEEKSGTITRTVGAYESVDFGQEAAVEFFNANYDYLWVTWEYYSLNSATPTAPIARASIDRTSIALGESITLTRDGISTSAGFAWTEATAWLPGGGYDVLGNSSIKPSTTVYTPSLRGDYSIQFRYVDADYSYRDQWITFTVY